MKFTSSSVTTLLITAGLLVVGAAMAQTAAGQAPTAKDEAIPALRDAPVVALTHIRVIDGTHLRLFAYGFFWLSERA